MELKTLVLTLSLVTCVFCEECKPSADNLVDVLEKEVDSFDQFIYGRYLQSEQGTCLRVTKGMSRLRDSFYQELSVVLAAARRQLQTVVDTAKGTDAGPCIEKMEQILYRYINEENSRFQQCLDVPAAQLEGLRLDLTQDTYKYTELIDRSKAALRSCLINFPATCTTTPTKCMDTQIDYFNTVAKNLTDTRIIRSPCMGKFVEALQCFFKSVENVMKKARMVQRKITACVSFEDSDITRRSILAFASNLTLNSNLLEQVKNAQTKFENLNSNVVKTLARYYELEKSAKLTYEFRPHDKEHFKKRLNEVFAGHLSTLEEVRRSKRHVWPDKKADECYDEAILNIRYVLDNASYSFENCEKKLLQLTQLNIQQVREELGHVTKDLSHVGDSVIMDCLYNGAILSENTIEGCYDLHLRMFLLDKQDALERVDKLMTVLEQYNATYFNVSESTSTLCGNSFFNRTEWFVDKIMFQLNRCPYDKLYIDEKIIITPKLLTEYHDGSFTWRYNSSKPYYNEWAKTLIKALLLPIPTTTYRYTDEPE